MKRCRSTSEQTQRGFALIFVLWMSLLLSFLAALILLAMRTSVLERRAASDRIRDEIELRNAAELARFLSNDEAVEVQSGVGEFIQVSSVPSDSGRSMEAIFRTLADSEVGVEFSSEELSNPAYRRHALSRGELYRHVVENNPQLECLSVASMAGDGARARGPRTVFEATRSISKRPGMLSQEVTYRSKKIRGRGRTYIANSGESNAASLSRYCRK